MFNTTEIQQTHTHMHMHTRVWQPFFQDYLDEPVPEEIFWTLWCKGKYHRQTHKQFGWAPLHPH